ncbi:MAG: EamA family transporter [Proteobacteria bacterium]|nr:EamA family transporter [Pseudomonadota bacterium]
MNSESEITAAAEATKITAPASGAAHGPLSPFDLTALIACSLIWGTTWFAITWQLGSVAPVVSVVYRFGLAAALLFGWCLVSRRSMRMSLRQHLIVATQGLFVFGLNYALVYLSEERIASAVAAVAFAGLAFFNVVLFRVTLGQKAPPAVWIAALLGLAGVGVVSWAELQRTHMDARAWAGLGFAGAAVCAAAVGNYFSHKAQEAGTKLTAGTAWAMAYGTAFLVIAALVSGSRWTFQWTVPYVASLLYLSLFGSVTAFVLYFALAKRRGYTFASYISAVTPLLAMVVSMVFEHARWGWEAFAGIALVVTGQVLMIRGRKA